MKEYIIEEIEKSLELQLTILKDKNILFKIDAISKEIINAYLNGNKLLIAGNGGSASDAQHIAGELVNRFNFDRAGLPAIALSADTSILTAISNDYGYEMVFSRQIQAYGVEGDVFLCMSTSGKSKNIIRALEECKRRGIKTIALTGEFGMKVEKYSDILIKVPSIITPRVQEIHLMIGHIICAIVEKEIFSD